STVLRAEKIMNTKGEEAAKHQIDMARLFMYDAVEKLARNGKEAILAFTQGDDQRILLMGLKRFTKWNDNPNPNALRRSIADKVIAENKYPF
ncbi:MAG: acyl-CoA dehydrogenase, partial [Bacteroidota bacterium]|nr:acyl-CoA dehydrogenase [Bacteroidota bacterium]